MDCTQLCLHTKCFGFASNQRVTFQWRHDLEQFLGEIQFNEGSKLCFS